KTLLRQKLKAYETLPKEERDRRLRALELRWYLRPLMSMNPQDRSGALDLVPARLQPLVQERLQQWDQLAPEVRKEILADENVRELATNYFVQVQRGRSAQDILASLPPAKRQELQNVLQNWSSIPSADRARLGRQLPGFFDLPREEQARAFEELPETERQDVERTLNAFARLSPEQRRVCVNSFQKFATMLPAERASFLRNAARWQAMTSEERSTWKQLVTKLPPLPSESLSEPPYPPSNNRSQLVTSPPPISSTN
ncbi:MAG TPA: DUF3106 domain-containing protein, partial [Verrucomicrobiae bacterium]|nr:DUF3106 domain-containing protein [Verrucomicrobiae bacterium]